MSRRILTVMLIMITIVINQVFAQIWVEVDDDEYFKYEYIVITEVQFNRLLRQFEAGKTHAMFNFEDALLKKPNPLKIISGSRPIFSGYYYLLLNITIDRNKIANNEAMYADMIEGGYLVYGNKNTGELAISFPNMFTVMLYQAFSPGNIAEINSDDYKQKIEFFLSLVKEE